MAETTGIEWTDATFNAWIGCTKVSPACDFCYAEALMDKRHHRVEWGGARSRTSASNWQEPRRWQKKAAEFFEKHGRRRRVFCSSLADVFDNQVPTEWRDDLWALIRDTPDLDWQLLTKRPQNIAKMLPIYPIWNEIKGRIWLGTTVEDQKRADLNIPHLLQHDAAVRFVSCEPLLGHIAFDGITNGDKLYDALLGQFAWRNGDTWEHGGDCRKLDWVIAGGESGPHARQTDPAWFISLRDQCAAADVPFLFKQWGDLLPEEIGPEDSRSIDYPPGHIIYHRVGKKAAGRKLHGVEHNGFPKVSA